VDQELVYNDQLTARKWALNSAVECHLHTVEVIGSNPIAPTILGDLHFLRGPSHTRDFACGLLLANRARSRPQDGSSSNPIAPTIFSDHTCRHYLPYTSRWNVPGTALDLGCGCSLVGCGGFSKSAVSTKM
jgi:hypothetical protein